MLVYYKQHYFLNIFSINTVLKQKSIVKAHWKLDGTKSQAKGV
jgi:hypothetical protein